MSNLGYRPNTRQRLYLTFANETTGLTKDLPLFNPGDRANLVAEQKAAGWIYVADATKTIG